LDAVQQLLIIFTGIGQAIASWFTITPVSFAVHNVGEKSTSLGLVMLVGEVQSLAIECVV
jgi:hypothetical protein